MGSTPDQPLDEPKPPEGLHCAACGLENPPDATVCQRCGTPLVQAPQPDIPDWLDSILAAPTSESGEVETPAAQAAIPDWLAELEAPASGAALPAGQELASDEAADWLRRLSDETEPLPETAGEVEASSEAAAVEAQPPAELPGRGVPDWLLELEAPADREAEPAEAAAPAEEAPGREGKANEAAEASQAEIAPEAPAEAERAAPLVAPGAPARLESEPAHDAGEPAEGAEAAYDGAGERLAKAADDLPDWLADFASSEGSAAEEAPAQPHEPGEPREEATSELPKPEPEPEPALAAPQEPPAQPPAIFEAVEGEIPDWLTMDFGEQEPSLEDLVPPLTGGDLLGLASALDEKPAEPEAAEPAVAPAGEELTGWLQGLQELAGMPEMGLPAAPIAPELLEQIKDLRFEAIAGEAAQAAQGTSETVGALKDVSGVIQPELIFEGSTLRVSEPVQELIVSERQAEQIALLRKLVARETQGALAAGEQRRALPLRWLAAVLLIVAVAAPVALNLLPLKPPPAEQLPSRGVAAAYRTIQSLATVESTVLVAVEYEPDTNPELAPLATALLADLAAQPGTTVYTISTRATGPAMADAVLHQPGIEERLVERGGTWANLGYISGRTSGIYSLAIGASRNVIAPWQRGAPEQAAASSVLPLSGSPVDLIIVVAARGDDLRGWIEQAARPTGIPVLAAMSAGAAPLAQPYADSGQAVAVLSGVNDAVAYRSLSGQAASDPLLVIWNAQASGSAVAAALIVLSSLVYGIGRLRNRQEPQP